MNQLKQCEIFDANVDTVYCECFQFGECLRMVVGMGRCRENCEHSGWKIANLSWCKSKNTCHWAMHLRCGNEMPRQPVHDILFHEMEIGQPNVWQKMERKKGENM